MNDSYYTLMSHYRNVGTSSHEVVKLLQFIDMQHRELEAASRRLAEAVKDKERLDWLEAQTDGSSWVARESNTGLGFRLHNTGEDSSRWGIARSTARGALDAAMAEFYEQIEFKGDKGTSSDGRAAHPPTSLPPAQELEATI